MKRCAARVWLAALAVLLAPNPAAAFDIDLVEIQAGPVKLAGQLNFQFVITIDGVDLGSEVGLRPPGSSSHCGPSGVCSVSFDPFARAHVGVFAFASQSELEAAFPSNAGAYTLEFENGVSASFSHSYQKLASSDSATPGFTEITSIDPDRGGDPLVRTSANPKLAWANCATCFQASTLEFDLFDIGILNVEDRVVFRNFEFSPPVDGMAVFPDDVAAIFFPNGKPGALTLGRTYLLEVDLHGPAGAAVIAVDDRDGDYLYRQIYRHRNHVALLITPEPSAGLLASLGLLGLAAARRRRR